VLFDPLNPRVAVFIIIYRGPQRSTYRRVHDTAVHNSCNNALYMAYNDCRYPFLPERTHEYWLLTTVFYTCFMHFIRFFLPPVWLVYRKRILVQRSFNLCIIVVHRIHLRTTFKCNSNLRPPQSGTDLIQFGEKSIQYAMDIIQDEPNILKFKFKMFERNSFYLHVQFARNYSK